MKIVHGLPHMIQRAVSFNLFKLKIFWFCVSLKALHFYFVFNTSLRMLINFVLLAALAYCFVKAIIFTFKKNVQYASQYLMVAVVICITYIPPIIYQWERFRYWIEFSLDRNKYEREVSQLPIGGDGFKRHEWLWGTSEGESFYLIYDDSDNPSVNRNSAFGKNDPCRENNLKITEHFYFIVIGCPGIF